MVGRMPIFGYEILFKVVMAFLKVSEETCQMLLVCQLEFLTKFNFWICSLRCVGYAKSLPDP